MKKQPIELTPLSRVWRAICSVVRRSYDGHWDFEIRLLFTLAMTLIFVGAMQFVLTSRETKSILLDSATRQANADVVFVRQAFESLDNDDARVAEMNQRLGAISQREGNQYVLLVDKYGVVAAASNPAQVGTYHGGPELRQVVESGRSSTEYIEHDNERLIRYIVPVDLPSGRFALEVEQQEAVINGQVSSVRKATLGVTSLGIGVGIVCFVFFGGRSAARIHRRALQLSSKDGLTNLDNHRSFQEALERVLAVSERTNSRVSLALVDLDDFKQINDRMGHGKGDIVLKHLGELLETGRIGDRAFRIGGDEFALVLPDTSSEGAWVVCERLWKLVEKSLDGATISIGVATSEGGLAQEDLCERADVALYEAKRRGRNTVVSFEELGGEAVIPAEKVRAVRRLLDDGVIGTAFQPIWDLQGERPIGFEALARPLPDYSIDGPGELFAIGEMIGRTQDLDTISWKWALERAKNVPEDILVFLNVSPFTADHGDAPIDRLCEVVEESGFPPSRIVVELTEKWSGRRDLVIQQAERLRSLGYKLALDDVGAGSGDLEMMAKLPVDFIKVDMHVVKNARFDSTARGVLYGIAAFAIHSGSSLIVEGIEDEEVLRFIHLMAHDRNHPLDVKGGQGYFLGKPTMDGPILSEAPYVPLTSEPDRFLQTKANV